MPATATVTIVLAMATLADATQIGLFLFMSHHPRWPWQVEGWLALVAVIGIFVRNIELNIANVNMA
jgi:hypothetical protein